jgi:hypothetical protein
MELAYLIQFILTVWGAWTVRLINRQHKYGLYSGILCNVCFLTFWAVSGQFGFLAGDLIYTTIFISEIYRSNKGAKSGIPNS